MEKYLKVILFPLSKGENGEIWVSGNMLCRLNIKDYLLTVQKIDIPMTSTGFMIEDKKQNVWIAKKTKKEYIVLILITNLLYIYLKTTDMSKVYVKIHVGIFM